MPKFHLRTQEPPVHTLIAVHVCVGGGIGVYIKLYILQDGCKIDFFRILPLSKTKSIRDITLDTKIKLCSNAEDPISH